MIKFFFILICSLFILTMSFKFFENPRYEIPQSEQAVNKLLSKMAGLFSKKYKLIPSATCVAMPSEIIKQLGLEFKVYGPISKEDIRKLLISCAQEFLIVANDNLEIRPYLVHYPLTIDNIEIALFVIDKNSNGVDHPHIGIAEINECRLKYLTFVTTDISEIKERYSETYEEALKAMEK